MKINNPTHKFYKATDVDNVTTFTWEIEDPRTRKSRAITAAYFVSSIQNPDGSYNAIKATHRNTDWIGGKIIK